MVEKIKRATFYIEPENYMNLRILAIEEKTSMKALVNEALEKQANFYRAKYKAEARKMKTI